MRVEETWVRHAVDTPKSQAGLRTIALGARVAAELFEHRRRTAFSGDDERVFANPRTGNPFDAARYAELLRRALKRAGVEGYVRPAHDMRHSSITNAAGSELLCCASRCQRPADRGAHDHGSDARRVIVHAEPRSGAHRLAGFAEGASGGRVHYPLVARPRAG
jgi:CO/xanthine dehydrogenase Mo-binding subunit